MKDHPTAPVELPGADGAPGLAALRAALSLAAIARTPVAFRWADDASGLTAPMVAAVHAMRAALCGEAEGANQGSRHVTFTPQSARAAPITIDAPGIPIAPLLEMLLPALSLSGTSSQLRLTGVTHAANETAFHDLAYGWLPLMEQLGFTAEVVLGAAGFAPDGGIIEARIFPTPRLKGLELGSRGLLIETQALALVANLGIGIALPLERRLTDRLRASGIVAQVEVLPMPADRSRGLAAVVLVQFERLRVAIVETGQPGRPPEEVADRAVEQLQRLLSRRGAIPGETMQRLLVPLALAASPHGAPGAIGAEKSAASRVTTTEVTPALLAVADVVRRLLPVEVLIQGLPGADGVVDVRPRKAS